ncbi:hypothetical protein [Roseovarius nanhaiticus]|uniref:PH domain-containing protein n=1 Tax=Roseovarius nanhaiticus TaxID=573024 RepID=A0A1N7F6W2_9RHOB|nr:hypothetical protein [Roseovarius nanhaiticus]SEK60485.1 hypothetical protein SAMN05216208_1334 [Roseovarius nanhaiticus]SIR96044.1 hypothetical protein SAMN05421666_0801 [Roseovarius nanhaiticus]
MSDPILRPDTAPAQLDDGERVRDVFRADRATYWRDHALMAAAAMAAGMAVLAALGNPHIWTGAVGGLAAIAIRAFYLSSEALQDEWRLTDSRLLGPGSAVIPLAEISVVRGLGSAVQVVTRAGDKYLVKYMADRRRAEARIAAAAGVSPA